MRRGGGGADVSMGLVCVGAGHDARHARRHLPLVRWRPSRRLGADRVGTHLLGRVRAGDSGLDRRGGIDDRPAQEHSGTHHRDPERPDRGRRTARLDHAGSDARMNAGKTWTPLEGGCDCREVRYRMETGPLFVHCCHCRWCQRETGASFALNAMIESDRVTLLNGEVEVVNTPSNSGKGQKIARCPKCRIALWSNYGGGGDAVRFVRVGTLDDPDRLPPDIHIYTSTKQPWVVLPADKPAVPEYYKSAEYWPK